MGPIAPALRVRARLLSALGPQAVAGLPTRYERLGRVLRLRIPEELRPEFARIGRAWQRELGVTTVLRQSGAIEGEWRMPRVEVIAGGPTETTLTEHGIRWTFDARQVMFARGNTVERQRVRALVRPNEAVLDLFAGIGYFAIPAALADPTVRVTAVEANPVAFGYLARNIADNGVDRQITSFLGDNRTVAWPRRGFDRVLLGYLPSSLPWVALAADALGNRGGSVHVHLVRGARAPVADVVEAVSERFGRAGARVESIAARDVKAYGPGRVHTVLDVEATPRGRPGDAPSAGP